MISLSPEDRDVRARARGFVDEHLIPHEVEAEMHDGELPPGVVEGQRARLRELGLQSPNMPKELGGAGLTVLQQTLVSEQIGRATNALGWVLQTPPGWLLGVATPHQLEVWLAPTVRGERHECYAITEEGAGSDTSAIQATARRDGEHYVLTGEKWHVTSFNFADHIYFQGRLTEGAHAGEQALFVVDRDTSGVRLVREPRYTHTYRDSHAIVAFDDVRVPAENLIGDEGDGMRYTYEWFRYERLMIAARCCGAAERLIDEASRFAQDRVQFGVPIAEHQGIQFPLADSLVELWAARLMTYATAAEMDAGAGEKRVHAHCSMAKLYASEMANRVADRAVQVFGGRGYMRENVAERFRRELRVDRIWEGTSEIQRVIVADQLFKRGVGLASVEDER